MKYKVGDILLIVKMDKNQPKFTPVGEYFIVENISYNNEFYMGNDTKIVVSEDEAVGPEIYNTSLFTALK